MPQLLQLWYCCSSAITVYACILFIRWGRKRLLSRPPYPPGPKALPLIGNIRDIPPSHEWLTYAQWSRQYNSSLIHVKLPGAHMIVINSAEAVFDLLEKRSAIYSDRPRMPMLAELVCWDAPVVYGYGPQWRNSRRMIHQFFNVNTSELYHPQDTKAVHELLYRLAHTPEGFKDHIRLMAGSFILNVTYGIDVRSADDPFVRMVEAAMQAISEAMNPGSFLVDTLPILKYVPEWFPGAGFKLKAKEWRKVNMAAIAAPFQYVKDAMAKGVHTPSVTSQILEQCQGDEDMEVLARATSGGTYFAGADTTLSALLTFILAMVLHPDVVQKAHEELDAVIGPDRLPDFSDKPYLPYICAIVKEVLRWYPVTPLAVAHRLMVDDVYEGMFLPAGSIVVGNAWAILHDADVYKDPEAFIPERFLKDGKLDPDIRAPEVAAFGFGRRICPGRHFALESIFLNIACMLATFDMEKAIDECGKPITPKKEFVSGLFSRPAPFRCTIKPRSEQAYKLITEAYAVYHP